LSAISLLVLFLAAAVLLLLGFQQRISLGYQNATVKAPLSRTRYDLRAFTVGIESYFVDYNAYPLEVPLRYFARGRKSLTKAGGDTLCATHTGGGGMCGLTTPNAYVVWPFPDRFAPEKDLPFAYHTDGPGWVLFSCGPDRHYDINPVTDYTSKGPQPPVALILKSYDPTNGLVSGGDIWRVRE
jgi:hypothetical protein